ncbi:MAG: hypothetical protein OEY33_00195 [Bdellovibrionales bacterium]|nr:hypothetical protein [Bdellovibrionales bacterium]
MKWILILLFVAFPAFSAELGEDVSNIECTKSIHRPRPTISQVKTNIEFSEDFPDEEATQEASTIQK